MPPVLGPASPSKARLKSWAGVSGKTVLPSLKKNRLTSWPSRNSSTRIPISMKLRAWSSAAWRSLVTMTPLPAARPSALITYGAPNAAIADSTSSMVEHSRAMPVGTPAAAITSLANDFEPSSAAAFCDGPKTAIPKALSASLTPATRGASGPTITNSTASSFAKRVTSSGEFGFRFSTVRTSPAIPALPGAATMFSAGVPVPMRDLMIACSRAP